MRFKLKSISIVPVVIALMILFLFGPLQGQVRGVSSTSFNIRNFSPGEYRAKRQNWSIVQDGRGIMYFANSAGILEYDSVEWRLIELPHRSPVYALARNPQGRIFAGGDGEVGFLEPDNNGTMRFGSLKNEIPPAYRGKSGRIVKIGFIPGATVFLFEKILLILEGDNVNAFKADDHFYTFVYACGSLYIIDDTRGLLRYSNGKLIDVPGGQLLRAYVMLPYPNNTILMVTEQEGLIIFDPHNKQNHFPPVNFQYSDFFAGNIISCGFILEDRTIVLGSVEKGIAVIDPQGNPAVYIRVGDGLQDEHVYDLCRDNEGNLWAGLDQGISLLSSSLVVNPGASRRGQAKSSFAALLRDCRKLSDNSLIFGGTYYSHGNRVPSLVQEGFQVPQFEYAFNGFRFVFGTTHYNESEKTMYSCYLDGLDKGWSEWMPRNSREYTNLGWGEYTLRVKARASTGEISQEAAYTFIVKPPWYETFLFMIGQVVFIVMVLLASRVMEGTGFAPKLSNNLIIFAVVVIFEYVNGFIGPLIGRYSEGIAFFGMLMTGVLSFIIGPAQEFLTTLLKKITFMKRMEG